MGFVDLSGNVSSYNQVTQKYISFSLKALTHHHGDGWLLVDLWVQVGPSVNVCRPSSYCVSHRLFFVRFNMLNWRWN